MLDGYGVKEIILFAYKLLYLEFFLTFLVTFGKWYHPFTLWMFGACMALLFSMIFSYKELITVEDKLAFLIINDMYHLYVFDMSLETMYTSVH